MAITERNIQASPQDVFDTLLDPYQYPNWVVGAKAIRDVDAEWPSPGAAFYHRLGAEGAELKDKTEILDLEPPHRISLRTFARPLGIARVVITVRPADTGAIVALFEEPEEGTKLRAFRRALDPLIHARNIEALRRLDRVVQIRSSPFLRSRVPVS